MGLVLLGLFLVLHFFLRSYTNHGQQLTLPDFIDMHISEATDLAEDKTFEIIVNDSTHIVGKPGGMIMNQNPKANSTVKENRKVYVTITKYQSDQIRLKSLPELYGREYEQKKKELALMKISSRIKGYAYDQGEPNHILEVYYNGQLIADIDGRKDNVKIEKGGTLDFVLSEQKGLEISIPDLRCESLAAASFMLEDGARLRLGTISEEGKIEDRESAYIIDQFPPYSTDGRIFIGEQINVVISSTKPEDCN
jgi:beta-lactam-binding protein with PASTA domain